jgi:hypothetical protein
VQSIWAQRSEETIDILIGALIVPWTKWYIGTRFVLAYTRLGVLIQVHRGFHKEVLRGVPREVRESLAKSSENSAGKSSKKSPNIIVPGTLEYTEGFVSITKKGGMTTPRSRPSCVLSRLVCNSISRQPHDFPHDAFFRHETTRLGVKSCQHSHTASRPIAL